MTLFEMMSGLSNGGRPGGGYDRTIKQGKGGGGQPQGGVGFGGVKLSPNESMRGRDELYARGGTLPDRTVKQGKGGGAPVTPSSPLGDRIMYAPESRMPGAHGSMDRQTRQGK